jgi:hypothetical protein
MKTNRRPNLLAAALLCALLAPATAAVAEGTNHWSFDVTPYLWIAGPDVKTSLPSVPPSTPPGVERFDTRVAGGAMLAAEARYRSVGVFVDFAWLRLDTAALKPGPAFAEVDLKSDLIHTTAGLSYRLPLGGKFHADVLAGARLWHVNEDIGFASGTLPGFRASGDRSWVDPVIGASLRYELSPRWSLVAKGTVGGFGVASDIAGEVFGGVTFRITDWCSVTAGYRYLHEEYSRDRFCLNLDAYGVLVGVGFQF